MSVNQAAQQQTDNRTTPESGPQPGFHGLSATVNLVYGTLENTGGETVKTAPVKIGEKELSYFGKPVSVSIEENKKIRKLKREFDEKAAAGILPGPCGKVFVEWGQPDGLRTMFGELAKDGKTNFIHLKEIAVGNDVRKDASPTKRVFVTGSCLFGKAGVSGITDKGKILNLCDPYQMRDATPEEYGRIRGLNFMDGFHGYEIQSALSRQGILEMTPADKIYFNAPFAPYILYAREAMRRGLMDEGVFRQWVGKLAERVSDIIEYEQGAAKCEIIAVDPLYKYYDLLTDASLSLEDVTAKITADDPWWAAYFANTPPETFSDLGYGSYSKVYYDLLNTPDDVELVAVEDQVETRILHELANLLKNNVLPQPPGNNRVTGLYPFVQFLAVDKDGQSTSAFISDQYGRKDLADEIFALAAASIPDATRRRAEASCREIRGKQAARPANDALRGFSQAQSTLPLSANCGLA